MNIYAIADLHLSGEPPAKPMTIFGKHWENHWQKIETDWSNNVKSNDIVIVAGDTSWGLKLEEALPDLQKLCILPGRKILVKGNHDYWWQTLKKMKQAVNDELFFLQNNFFPAEDIAICGTRGWLNPDDPAFNTEKDYPTYKRELLRLENSLRSAQAAGYKKIIAAMHFPPVYQKDRHHDFINILVKYNAAVCVYGHLHGEESHQLALQGNINGVKLSLVACDAVGFKLVRII